MARRSFVAIAAAADLTQARAAFAGLGRGPGSFTAALSASGTAPATHYGLHDYMEPDWHDRVLGIVSPGLPAGDVLPGPVSGATVNSVFGALIRSIKIEGEPSFIEASEHFDAVIAAAGLQRIVEP